MPPAPSTGLYDSRPRQLVVRDMVQRSRQRLEALSDAALIQVLENALYQERKRLERQEPDEGELERLDALARALVHGDRAAAIEAGLAQVAAWADEIHGRFDPRMYRFATRIMPTALTALLSQRPRPSLRSWFTGRRRDLDVENRVLVRGDVERLQGLAREATLVACPTHVSNLDSPLIGLALHLAGLPPFVYGAGLNLFSNPVMGFFLRRLGAYTVDRTKKADLYKRVLKDYSVRCLTTHHHSLFFPGGTRSRSGRIETYLKKGLLGTAITAWQENLARADGDSREIYVVPVTLSFQLVLEANSLIDDFLEREGKQHYIMTDDEFTEPRTVANFARRVLDLDDAVVVHFGDPIDCLGAPVPLDPDERAAQAERSHRYVTDGQGRVEWDEQRDRIYTERLADALVEAYPSGAWVMSTHLVAWAAWALLEQQAETTDPFRLVRVPPLSRHLSRSDLRDAVCDARSRVDRLCAEDRCRRLLPDTADAVIDQALDRFAAYHRSRALADHGTELVIEDPRLCLYYRNRLDHPDLLGATAEEA